MHKGKIYCFTSPSDKSYVGQTWSEQVLGKNGRYTAYACGEGQLFFYNAIKKYGLLNSSAWMLVIVQDNITTQNELDEAERRWILRFRTVEPEFGYNLTEGGQGGKPNKETRKKLSKSAKISQNRPDVRQRKSKSMKAAAKRPEVKARNSTAQKLAQNRPEVKARNAAGQKVANMRPGVRERRSNAQKRAQNKPEWKARNSISQKNRRKSPEFRARQSAVQKKAQNRRETKEKRRLSLKKWACIRNHGLECGCHYE